MLITLHAEANQFTRSTVYGYFFQYHCDIEFSKIVPINFSLNDFIFLFRTILQNAKQEFSKRVRIHLLGRSVGRSVDRSVDPSLGCKLLFVFPLTNAQQHVVRAFSYFNCFKKPRKHLLSQLRSEHGLLASMGFSNIMHATHEYRAK